jgi:hypothetical protein
VSAIAPTVINVEIFDNMILILFGLLSAMIRDAPMRLILQKSAGSGCEATAPIA